MLNAMALRGSDVSAVVDVLDALDSAPSDEAGFLGKVADSVDRLVGELRLRPAPQRDGVE
jgi:hypothetical protein